MGRRIITGLAAAGLLGAGVVAAAPAQAVTCPTPGGTTANAWVIVPVTGSAPAVQLQAQFDDPTSTVGSVTFRITGPGVDTRAYPGSPSVAGSVKTYTASYRPSNGNKPGVYTVSAYSSCDSAATTAPVTFVVKHQTRLTMYPTAYAPARGSKIRFYGTLYPTVGAAGQKLRISFKAKGTKGWKDKGTVTTKSDGGYRTKKLTMSAYGKWRITSPTTSYLLGSKAGMVYKKI